MKEKQLVSPNGALNGSGDGTRKGIIVILIVTLV